MTDLPQALNPALKNWHWRTKGVEPWAREWFKAKVDGLSEGGVTLTLKDTEGDCEVGMRKSKLVTIYDIKITMDWAAETKGGDPVTGSLVALEVAHDMDEDDYQFTSSIDTGSGSEAETFNKTAKKKLADKLRPIFQEFPKAMLDTHGKDLLADAAASEANTPSGASTPAAPASAPKSTATVPSVSDLSIGSSGKKASIRTAVVKASGEFASDAEGLFDFLTNPDKIPLWSRNPAKMKAEVGADVSIFNGNITGKVTAVERPKSFTMTWRAPTWPEDHFGALETTLAQGSNSTTLELRLAGVPIGKEDEAERNLNIYYIQGLKQIGSVLPPFPTFSHSAATARPRPQKRAPQGPPPKWAGPKDYLAVAASVIVSAGVLGAILAGFYYGPSGPGGGGGAKP